MKKPTKIIMIITISIVLCVLAIYARADPVPTLVTTESDYLTPKTEYSPEEMVYIVGTGFANDTGILVSVTRPDGFVTTSADSITDTFKVTITSSPDGMTDSSGSFTATYQLDGVHGEYIVTATDGTNTATTTFTDPAITLINVTLSPTSVVAGSTVSFTLTISVPADNPPNNYNSISSINISMGAGWDTPTSVVISGSGISSWTTHTASAGLLKIKTTSSSPSASLNPGESMTVTFDVTAPSSTGASTWSITGYNNNQFGGSSNTQTQGVNVMALTVTKTASTSLKRTYTWTIDKWADQSELTIPVGVHVHVNYEVKVDATSADSDWAVSGTIKIDNPSDAPAVINVDDVVSPDIEATVSGASFPYTLGAHDTLNLVYSADLPDDSSRTNTATVTVGAASFSDSEDVKFSSATIDMVDERVTVHDSYAGDADVLYDEVPKTLTYDREIGPYGTPDTYTVGNTADFETCDNKVTDSDSWAVTVHVFAPGTTLSADIDATYSWTRTFGWTIDKSVTPDTWDIFKGDSCTSRYTITLTKDAGTDVAYIEGDVDVENTGGVATENLAITVEVKYGGTVVGTDTLAISGQLDAGDSATYSYHVDIAPADLHEGGSYDVIAHVTITNYQDHLGSPYGPEPSTTKTLNPTLKYDTVNVDDTNGGSWAFSASGSVWYDKIFTDEDEGDNDNTATIRETGQSTPTTTVTVNVYELEVTKDAGTLITRTYTWTIDKWADATELVLGEGATQDVDYHVQVSATFIDAYSVSGSIHVHNPAPISAVILSISDIVSPDIAADVDFGVTFPYTLAAGGTLDGTYSESLPDDDARTNIATATIQNYYYDWVPVIPGPSGTTDFSGSAPVDFTIAPVNEVDESITLSDTNTEFGGPKTVYYTDLTAGSETFDYTKEIGPYDLPGIYTVENTASFETCDNKVTDSDSWTVTVYRIGSAVTSSSFYYFDYDSAVGRQFKLILTPDVPLNPNLYRVTATNPGQFFYDIFYYAASPTTTPFTITVPDPFVPQVENAVHIYDSISTSGDYMLPGGTEITSQFTIEATSSGSDFTGYTITPKASYSGPVYVTIHLDLGWKKTLSGLGKDAFNNALVGTGPTVSIYDLSDFTFLVAGPLSDTDTIENRNAFKRDPGFVGLVTDSYGNPLEGVAVKIYGPDGKLLATVYTDKDGWYFYNYKYTGKAATFTIKLPAYNKSTSVIIKSNSMTKIDFVVP